MSAVRILLPCAQYETLLKDDWEMHNDNERDYARMPFELRVVEAALDVVRPFWSICRRCWCAPTKSYASSIVIDVSPKGLCHRVLR